MARPRHGSDALPLHHLIPLSVTCQICGHAAHIAYHTERIITTLAGQHHLHLAVRRCISPDCPRYHQPYRPVGVILTEKYDVPYNSSSILCLRSQLESSCSQNGSIGSSALTAQTR